jgi:hypothetical protein
MREPALRFAALDWFGHCPPPAGLSVAPDQLFDMRLFSDVRETESADEWEHLWIELGGEG